jgi:Na+/serine symporter
VGHLESLWSPLKIILVGLIAVAAVQLLTYPLGRTGNARLAARHQSRTSNGRLTRASEGGSEEIAWAVAYFPAAVAVTAATATVAFVLGTRSYPLGYILYGMVAVLTLIVPSVLAFWWGREVPYPTLYRTLADLDHRSHLAVTILLAGLAILAVHLVAFPWP